MVEFAPRAAKDVRKLPARDRARVLRAINTALAPTEPPANADIKPLSGKSPWLRLRVGDLRVLYRPHPSGERGAVLVCRVVNRRDLERGVSGLD